MLRHPAPAVSAVLLALSLAACDGVAVEEQRAFEDRAFALAPSGVTRTDADGVVLDEDADDWRIGPAFRGFVQTLQVPYPNPLPFRATAVYQLNVVVGVPGGLALYRLNADGRLTLVGRPCEDAVASAICTIAVQGSEVSPIGETDLVRLVLLDGRGGVVSYGDVQPTG